MDSNDNSSMEDWDVESYRGTHESVEHWELRKQFMVENKGRFSEIRLVCLSQVFANMEFLGCKYPLETMELVAELSQGIVENYREKQQNRIQRTFVKASDAAERKTKGQKRPTDIVPKSVNKIFVRESCIQPPSASFNSILNHQTNTDFTSDEDFNFPVENNLEQVITTMNSTKVSIPFSERELSAVRELVIVEHPYTDKSPVEILFRSCGMSHTQCVAEYSDSTTHPQCNWDKCLFKIGNHFLMEGEGFSKDSAKLQAALNALEKLRQVCYTIQVKKHIVESERQVSKNEITHAKEKRIEEDNIGNKLLRLMGWSGGGLGKNNQGIEDIADVTHCVGRAMMGLSGVSFSAHSVKAYLTKEMSENGINELVFTSEFNSDERKIIHSVAGQLGLKSRSHGKDENRFLVLSRKIKLMDLVRELLTTGETDKYRVIRPTDAMYS